MAKLIAVVISALLLTACAGPKFQSSQPIPPSERFYDVSRSALLDETSHVTGHLDKDKNILYFQNFGGGGAAVGLLFGPLGVGANVAMINSNTNSDIELLYEKLSVKPREIFLSAQKEEHAPSRAAGNSELELTPYLYVSKTNGDQLLFAAALIIETGTGEKKWTGKYMYQLPIKHTIAEAAQLDPEAKAQLAAQLRTGFDSLLKYVYEESPAVTPEPEIVFRSDFIDPRFNFEIFGTLISKGKEMTWIRTWTGVYALQNPNVTFKPRS